MIIHIVSGGPKELLPDLTAYFGENCIWVGVDKGVHTLLSHGINPELAFGDFDSVSNEQFLLIKEKVKHIYTFPKEKDETDTEYALSWAVKQKPEKIRIFGATGGRLDHFLANTHLLFRFVQKEESCPIEIIDQKNFLFIARPGTHHLERLKDKKYISFLPISNEVKGLTLRGFKYPLTNKNIPLGSTLCISNELIHNCGTFSFSDGILMVIRSSD